MRSISFLLSMSILLILLPASASTLAENKNTTSQITQQAVPPLLETSDLELSIELPTEGSAVIARGFVTNNDNQSYTNIRLVIYILEESNHPDGGRSLKEVGAKIIDNIDPSQIVGFSITIELDAGIYALSSTIFYNNVPIEQSTSTISILVLSSPKGDIPTILVGLLLIATSLVLAVIVPSTYDKFRIGKAMKKHQVQIADRTDP